MIWLIVGLATFWGIVKKNIIRKWIDTFIYHYMFIWFSSSFLECPHSHIVINNLNESYRNDLRDYFIKLLFTKLIFLTITVNYTFEQQNII